MPGIFDSKNFNSEVFAKYVEQTPNLNRNELIKSKAIRNRQDIAAMFPDQVGGNYATVPIVGRIGGKAQNYNGSTDIVPKKLKTFTQGRVVVGRADAWVETDFSYDITGGTDFLAHVAEQLGEYWDGIDQGTLLSTLKGIFSMPGAKNIEFVNGHTYDISDQAGDNGNFGAITMNNAIQKALGDNKAKFTLAIMHSVIATNCENLKLLEYMKYTDKDGIERQLTLGHINGKLVLVDDTMPVEEVEATENEASFNKYTTYVLGDGAIEYTNCGVKVPYETNRDPAKNGGQDTLYGRQRKIFAPYGVSYKDNTTLSPLDTDLEKGANWTLANSNEGGSAEYFPHKAIPIARVITRG